MILRFIQCVVARSTPAAAEQPGCFLAVLFLLLATQLTAAPIEPVDPAPDKAADFYVDVYPVLEAKCLACHSRTTHESDLVLEDLAGILKGGASGPAVVAGQPEKSLLFQVCSRIDESAMPPLPNKVGATALTPHELGRLRRWITEGAQPGKSNPSAAAIGWQALPSTMVASYAMALGPQERFVALGRANTVTLCDLVTGREVAQLGDPLLRTVKTASLLPLYDRDVAHFDVVSSLAFSPDGDWIASGGYREIKMWQRQRHLSTLRFDVDQDIRTLSIGAAGMKLLVALGDGTLSLWNLESGEQEKTAGPVAGLSQAALTADDSRALVVKENGEVAVRQLAEGSEVLARPVGAAVTATAIAGSGKWFVTGHADGVIRRWLIPAEAPAEVPAATHESPASSSPVQQLVVSADESRVLARLADGRVVSVNSELQDLKETLHFSRATIGGAMRPEGSLFIGIPETGAAEVMRPGSPTPVLLPTAPPLALEAKRLEDDKTVGLAQKSTAEEAVKQADKESMERAASQMKAEEARTTANEGLTKAQQQVDELEAALKLAQDKLVELPEDESRKKAVTEAEAALVKPREALTAARDGLAAAERNVRFAETAAQAGRSELAQRKLVLEAVSTRVQESEQKLTAKREAIAGSTVQIRSAAISPDSMLIATGHSDGLVHLWAADDGRWLDSFAGHSAAVRWLEFAKDQSLASAGDDRAVIVWNLQPQWKLAAVLGTKPENRLDASESPLVDRVLCLAFSPDGRLLASGGGEPSRSGEVVLWDVGSLTIQRALRELHSDTVNALAFSRDGRRLLTGAADKFAKVSDVESGNFVRAFEGHTGHVLGVAWKADAGSLATGGADGAVKVWNSETGEQRKSIAATSGQLTAVAYLGLSDQVAGATSKNDCLLLDGTAGKTLRTFQGAAGYVYQVAASDDGRRVAASGEDGVLRVWNAADGKVVREFKPGK